MYLRIKKNIYHLYFKINIVYITLGNNFINN